MKKILVLIFCVITVLMFFACNYAISDEKMLSKTDTVIARAVGEKNVATTELGFAQEVEVFAQEVIKSYYYALYKNTPYTFSDVTSNKILPLLQARIERTQEFYKVAGRTHNSFELEIIQLNDKGYTKSTTTEGTTLFFQVKQHWLENNIRSGISEVVEIVISKNKDGSFHVENFFLWYNDIDTAYQKLVFVTRASDTKIEEFLHNFKLMRKKTLETIKTKMTDELTNNSVSRSTTILNRTQIKDWARDNYNANSPISAIPNVSYYDFSTIPGNWDCTNFVSHALYAGGATMRDDGYSGITGSDQWYYRSNGNRSSSWAGVNQLYQFLTRTNPGNNNIGPCAIVSNDSDAEIGDIVQFHNGSIWRHSTIITDIANNIIYVTGRTAPNYYNDDASISQMLNTYTNYRILHLSENYN